MNRQLMGNKAVSSATGIVTVRLKELRFKIYFHLYLSSAMQIVLSGINQMSQ